MVTGRPAIGAFVENMGGAGVAVRVPGGFSLVGSSVRLAQMLLLCGGRSLLNGARAFSLPKLGSGDPGGISGAQPNRAVHTDPVSLRGV